MARSQPQQQGAPSAHRSPWRMLVSTAVTVAVLAVVFLGVFPKVADYSQAWSSIRQMPSAYLVAPVLATVVNLAVYVWPLQAALPGLGYGPGFVVRQTSFAISNAVPAGGAVGLACSTACSTPTASPPERPPARSRS